MILGVVLGVVGWLCILAALAPRRPAVVATYRRRTVVVRYVEYRHVQIIERRIAGPPAGLPEIEGDE